MGRLKAVAAMAAAVVLAAGPAGAGETVAGHIDAGQRAYQKGDTARAAHELEAAVLELQSRLGRALSDALPPVPAGWQAEDAEVDGLGSVGGGLSVTRAYTKADSSLNVSIILDSPAVEAAAAPLANSADQPNLKRIKVGAEDALLRWDASAKSGEITVVIAGRILLQIEGDNLPTGDVLVDMAKGFDTAAIHKVIGV
jgi:hypothetical protein